MAAASANNRFDSFAWPMFFSNKARLNLDMATSVPLGHLDQDFQRLLVHFERFFVLALAIVNIPIYCCTTPPRLCMDVATSYCVFLEQLGPEQIQLLAAMTDVVQLCM